MFAEEVEQLLHEREKKAELFFKEENDEEKDEGIGTNHDEAITQPGSDETAEDNTIQSNEIPSNDVDMKVSDAKDVRNDTSVLDISHPLMLEEGSSDDNASEKDLEKIFSHSATKANDSPSGSSNEIKYIVDNGARKNIFQLINIFRGCRGK